MKILNLDQFAKEDRVLKIDGIDHQMKEMSVEDYIDLNDKAEKMDASGEPVTQKESVEFMIESITKVFPTVSAEVLKKRSMSELTMITSFARGELDSQLEENNKKAADLIEDVKKKPNRIAKK